METLEPIAVIGMACRFPGAADLDQFWANLVAGQESISFWDDDPARASAAGAVPPVNPDYVPAAPVMPDADRFDAKLFGMTAREAELCDPQLRIFLEICHAALEHAGYDPFAMPDSVGVFGGTGPNGYFEHCLRHRPDLLGPAGLLAQSLNQTDYLSTLVAYRLDLHGPALTVLTACSSSLVTVHLACQALRTGECDAAVAGGSVVDVPGNGYLWTPGNVLSRDGHCRPFDADATGTVFGSGAGAVVLKRLDDAVADGDHVKAVILGSAVNNDGREKVSFSAPSVSGQVAVVMEAMALAGVAAHQVDYVEAHATGTALGDPVEVAALAEAYRAPDGEPPATNCVLGSVKSNIGHAGAAAGIAGLIKTVLMLEREAIPPTINLDRPNPLLELGDTPFTLAGELRSWPRDPDRARIAGVTSLGIGGTNAHAILTEAPPARYEAPDGRPRVLAWSAGDEAGARKLQAGLASFIEAGGEPRFVDTVATLQHGRTRHRYRAATVARSATEAVAALRGSPGAAAVASGPAVEDPAIGYLLPGQGSGGGGMARGLYGTVRAFTVPMDECIDAFEQLGVPLYEHWTAGGAAAGGDVADQLLTQSLLFSVEYALAGMWRQWNVPPVAVLGHSLGELSAAAVAEVFTLADAAALVVARAEAMAAHPVPGGMLAVAAAEERVLPLLDGAVAVAAVNGANQVVVSGADEALDRLASRLAGSRIASTRVPVAAAFHHPGWQGAADAWAKAFAVVAVSPPRTPLYSARTGRAVSAEDVTRPAFWTGALVEPVRFHDALTALLRAARFDALLEVGPGATLSQLARRHELIADTARIASLRDGRPDHPAVLDAAARLWVAGWPIDWSATGQPRPRVRLAVPGYPYERIRYWAAPPSPVPGTAAPDAVAPAAAGPDATVPAVTASGAGARRVPASDVGVAAAVVSGPEAPRHEPVDALASGTPAGRVEAVSTIRWVEREPRPPSAPPADGQRSAFVLLPADPDAALAVLSAVQRAGLRPIRVRHGAAFAERPGEFRVRPGEDADLHQALDRMAGGGAPPEVVVHAATYGPAGPPDGMSEGFFSLLALFRVIVGSQRWSSLPAVVVITSGSADVSGGEPVDAANAALPALLRAVRAESTHLRAVTLDVGGRVDVPTMARELAAEITEPVVALRGRRRWSPVEVPHSLVAQERGAIREHGVYLITGGTGGLGLEVAKGLAGTGLRPTIVLISRSGLTGAAEAAAEEIRGRGAELVHHTCDVTDGPAVERVLADITARFGPVNGLLHLAGAPGGRMVAFRDPRDAAAVLAPKVHGTQVLERAFAARPPLDFAVYFSSRAAVDGLVGGADYAAANAYLDGAASGSALARGRVLSVGWPVWRDVGMAVNAGVDIGRLNDTVHRLESGSVGAGQGAETVWERQLGAQTDWVLDEHRVRAVPLLPGTAYVDLILRAFRETLAPAGEQPVVLSDVVFRAPFFDRAMRLLQVTFRPAEGHHTVLVRSRAAGGGPWLDHVTATVRTGSAPAPRIDLDGLRRRFDAAGTVQPRSTERAMFTLGPRWRNLVDSVSLDTQRLVRVQLPVAYCDDLTEHILHPALLDTLTATVRGPGQASSVPFLYERITVFAPLPERVQAHVRRTGDASPDTASGDLDLFDEDGHLLVSIEGFTMVMVDEQRLRDSAAASTTGQPGAAGQSEEPEPDGPDGLDPVVGVELLLRMLDAGLAGPVLVRPFAAGGPVPLAAGSQPPAAASVAAPVPAPPAPGGQPSGPPGPAVAAPPVAGPEAPLPTEHPEAVLRALWLQTLGTTDIVADQDFFDAGGNSLSAVELMARIREVFGIELRIGLLLEARTFSELAVALQARLPVASPE